jgi:AcrR family transcriptional regulator
MTRRKPDPTPAPEPDRAEFDVGATAPEDTSTRDRLLAAAMALVESDGPAGLGLRDVARRAGLTHNAPYRHFKDRRALVIATAERGFRELLDASLARQRAAGADHLGRFWALGVGYFLFAIERPGLFRLMFSPEVARAPELRSAESAVFSLCVAAIASGQSAGVVMKGDPQQLALTAWATMHGLALLHLDGLVGWVGIEAPPEVLAKRISETVFRGLASSEVRAGGSRPGGPSPSR